MMSNKEIWKVITNFSKYEISNKGNVRRKKDKRLLKLIPNKQRRNYIQTRIYNDNNERKSLAVHRIVAQEFINNENPKRTVINHKNGIPYDNRVENLEWMTLGENTIHAFKTGLIKNNPMKPVKVGKYDLNNNLLDSYDSVGQAARLNNSSRSNIQNVLQGKQKTAAGYFWKRL